MNEQKSAKVRVTPFPRVVQDTGHCHQSPDCPRLFERSRPQIGQPDMAGGYGGIPPLKEYKLANTPMVLILQTVPASPWPPSEVVPEECQVNTCQQSQIR
jgi:hypothetical protein